MTSQIGTVIEIVSIELYKFQNVFYSYKRTKKLEQCKMF